MVRRDRCSETLDGVISKRASRRYEELGRRDFESIVDYACSSIGFEIG